MFFYPNSPGLSEMLTPRGGAQRAPSSFLIRAAGDPKFGMWFASWTKGPPHI